MLASHRTMLLWRLILVGDFFYYDKERRPRTVCVESELQAKQEVEKSRECLVAHLGIFCVLFVVRLLVEHGVCELKGRSILLFSLSFWIRSLPSLEGPRRRRRRLRSTKTLKKSEISSPSHSLPSSSSGEWWNAQIFFCPSVERAVNHCENARALSWNLNKNDIIFEWDGASTHIRANGGSRRHWKFIMLGRVKSNPWENPYSGKNLMIVQKQRRLVSIDCDASSICSSHIRYADALWWMWIRHIFSVKPLIIFLVNRKQNKKSGLWMLEFFPASTGENEWQSTSFTHAFDLGMSKGWADGCACDEQQQPE